MIFDKTELKQFNSSAQIIEMTFNDLFETKSYTGNSEAAILIQIPGGTFDECQLGQVLVKINNTKWTQLQDIAFRIIDLGDTKSNFSEVLAIYEGKFYNNKKQTIKVNAKL
ncbi:hypothetical protein [Pararhodonellum marinum]|uniref:hypothetical protein n=1 Tax=Pararhodonellum marinum TaxID=2755358 RepID=UPI00188F80F1|nr:hypothetical protein [Pararhodonellum marinum]